MSWFKGLFTSFGLFVTLKKTSQAAEAGRAKKTQVHIDKDWKNRAGLTHVFSKRGILKDFSKDMYSCVNNLALLCCAFVVLMIGCQIPQMMLTLGAY